MTSISQFGFHCAQAELQIHFNGKGLASTVGLAAGGHPYSGILDKRLRDLIPTGCGHESHGGVLPFPAAEQGLASAKLVTGQ